LWVDGYTLVAPFGRDAVLSEGSNARVVARWIDGSPAAVERPIGEGCIRDVAIRVPDTGDVSISPGFRRIAEALTAPCGAMRESAPLDDAQRAMLAGEGPREVALDAASSLLVRSRLAGPLLLLSLLALVVELGVRRRT
jgi:hypothetical protein